MVFRDIMNEVLALSWHARVLPAICSPSFSQVFGSRRAIHAHRSASASVHRKEGATSRERTDGSSLQRLGEQGMYH